MKKQKKKGKPPVVQYSVGRFIFAFYKGKRMSWGYLQALGASSQVIREVRTEAGLFQSPTGYCGGPVEDGPKVIEYLTQLLSHPRVEGTHFDPEELKLRVRYHIMLGDVITVDEPPNDSKGELDYTKNNGYKSLELANAAAQSFFNYYEKWLRDSKNQPIQPVKLILRDKTGNITTKKSNNYKP